MPAFSSQLKLTTNGDGDVVDLTRGIADVVTEAGVDHGIVSVFVPGSTAAITTLEHEPGGLADLRSTLERLVPSGSDYEHNRLNHDTNAHAHVRAAIVGPSETVPVEAGRLLLGMWQQIALIDFDDRPRERTVIVNVLS